MNDKTSRCQTCGLTDEQYTNSALACRDPWHADDHLRRTVARFPPPPPVRSTHTYTYAELPLSKAAYNEIAVKLRDAGYGHAFMENGLIDMNGIGVAVEVEDVDQTALDAANAIMKALVDCSGKPHVQQKAAVQVIVRDALRKCQTK